MFTAGNWCITACKPHSSSCALRIFRGATGSQVCQNVVVSTVHRFCYHCCISPGIICKFCSAFWCRRRPPSGTPPRWEFCVWCAVPFLNWIWLFSCLQALPPESLTLFSAKIKHRGLTTYLTHRLGYVETISYLRIFRVKKAVLNFGRGMHKQLTNRFIRTQSNALCIRVKLCWIATMCTAWISRKHCRYQAFIRSDLCIFCTAYFNMRVFTRGECTQAFQAPRAYHSIALWFWDMDSGDDQYSFHGGGKELCGSSAAIFCACMPGSNKVSARDRLRRTTCLQVRWGMPKCIKHGAFWFETFFSFRACFSCCWRMFLFPIVYTALCERLAFTTWWIDGMFDEYVFLCAYGIGLLGRR